MNPFRYIKGKLHVENVPVSEIATAAGTPLYVYSAGCIADRYQTFEKAFKNLPHLTCYALKANSNASIAKLLAGNGAGCDIVSGGELKRALHAGFKPGKIVFSGVGKTQEEIEAALKNKILMLNVESGEELQTIRAVAKRTGIRAPIGLRLNPDIDPDTHHHITTGKAENKFGIHSPDILRLYVQAHNMPELSVVGIHCHMGSQIMDVQPYREATVILLRIVTQLKKQGINLKYLDIGGGMGITYKKERPFTPAMLNRTLAPLLKGTALTVIFEPGRYMVGEAGILVTKTLYRKSAAHKPQRHFIIVDAGMNDLIRPALYEAYHEILPALKSQKRQPTVMADVVGPVCESGDYLAKERRISLPDQGDLLCVMTAGAYGMTMSSNYNSRPRAAEALVKGNKWRIIRHRETMEDILQCEQEALSCLSKVKW